MSLWRICKPKPNMSTDAYAQARLRPAIRMVAIVGVLTSLVLGCGDDDGANIASVPATTEEVTKARYIEQGDAACARHNRKIQREVQAYLRDAGQSSQAKVADEIVNRVLVPRMGHEIRTVRAYVLPPENVNGALRVLAAMQTVVDRAEKDPVAFLGEGQPFAKAERLAREFGFKVCGGL